MRLILSTLEKHGGKFVPFSCEASLGIEAPGNETAVMTVRGRASYVKGRVLVQGSWHVEIKEACSRCLEQTTCQLEEQFDEVFLRFKGVVPAESEEHESPEEDDILFYTGEVLDLTEYLRQSFLMSRPLKVLCRDDCRGLCPVCGVDRNKEKCGCRDEMIDPRLRVLKNLKNK